MRFQFLSPFEDGGLFYDVINNESYKFNLYNNQIFVTMATEVTEATRKTATKINNKYPQNTLTTTHCAIKVLQFVFFIRFLNCLHPKSKALVEDLIPSVTCYHWRQKYLSSKLFHVFELKRIFLTSCSQTYFTTSPILIIKAFLVLNYTIVLYPERSWNGILLYMMLYRLSLFSFVVLNKMKSSSV